MNTQPGRRLALGAALAIAVGALALAPLYAQDNPTKPSATQAGQTRVALVFRGGYDLDGRDHGRPVALIAAALGVPDEVFRDAFRRVTPASGGREPDPRQVQQNKRALLDALGRYGVTNDWLDTVSNYYRYPPGRGGMWRHRPAAGYATVKDGAVVDITVTDPGAGYTSAPTVTLDGIDRPALVATVWFGPRLDANGSIRTIKPAPTRSPAAP